MNSGRGKMRQKLLLRTVRQTDRHRGVNHYAPLHSRNAQCMIEIIWIEKKIKRRLFVLLRVEGFDHCVFIVTIALKHICSA